MCARILLASGLLLLAAAAWPAKAQVIVDMSLITCQQYLDSPPDRQNLIAWWMRGYFSAAKNFSVIDFRYIDYNTKIVTAYCKKKQNRYETLMSAIQKNAR
jgi:acid stress chaperone HdeB